MTHEERLAEAEVTEEYNKAYLEYYQQYELEKKRVRAEKKAAPKGPSIRFRSFLEPVPQLDDTDEMVEQRQSRNLVTFLDWPTPPLAEWKPKTDVDILAAGYGRMTCPITGLPAKYRDPLTRIPYANAAAFKAIRAIAKDKVHWNSKLHVWTTPKEH